ncbi:MAG: hypothetical protein HY907_19510 [Deltaproteobacteria bacterium]|nr:hypothetical protein [Deltaproteobacteria bacterium]
MHLYNIRERHASAAIILAGLAALLLPACCGRGTCPGARPVPPADAAVAANGDASSLPAVEPAEGPADAGAAPAEDAPPAPEAIVTTVPDIPEGPCPGESQCTVTLHPPAAGRTVRYVAEAATITLGLDDVLAEARERRETELLEFLEARSGGEDPIPLNEAALAGNRVPYVVAALLDDGKAAVREDRAGRDAETIVRETWDWIGCGGGCRQAGRQYRFAVPGEVFFRTTDLFEDSF